uniref:Uncharacterized protein n=1 Tax=Meloidogyne enterolobii TaxID=390850 RepID=A0A6V7V3S5_MELEN|nr:unnamed protein product [Meloidogyne enterolobii]
MELIIENNNLKSKKYQLSNKHNPKLKFSIYNKQVHEGEFDVEIKRIF